VVIVMPVLYMSSVCWISSFRAPRDLRARLADEHIFELAAPHHLADRHLAHFAQRGLRVLDREEHFLGIGELVLHCEPQVDEIHVRGQHARFVLFRLHARDIHLDERLDRPRPPPTRTLVADVHELAEAQDHALLGRLDLKYATGQPERQRHDRHEDEHGAALAPPPTTGPEKRLQPALPAFHALIQIRTVALTTGPAAPRIVLTRLIPRHRKN
jgi:hypothetical protein